MVKQEDDIVQELDDDLFEELESTVLNEEPSLEELILDGVEVRKPVSVTLPNGKTGGALIKPLTGAEWNNCMRQFKKKDIQTDIVKKGLLTKDGKKFPAQLVDSLPAGAISELFLAIQELSGVQRDKKAEEEFTKQLIDF